jgi:hypothetical protein
MKVVKKEFSMEPSGILQHPFLIQLRHYFQDEQRCTFIFDFVVGGPVLETLSSISPLQQQKKEEAIVFYSAQIVMAIQDTHHQKRRFVNLISSKILLDMDGTKKKKKKE